MIRSVDGFDRLIMAGWFDCKHSADVDRAASEGSSLVTDMALPSGTATAAEKKEKQKKKERGKQYSSKMSESRALPYVVDF